VFHQALLLPVFNVVFIFANYFIIRLWRSRRGAVTSLNRWIIRPLTSIALAQYVPLCLATFSMLFCRHIGDYYVISAAPAYLCSGPSYTPWLVGAIIIVAVFIIGTPATLTALMIYRRKAAVDEKQFVTRFGYLYEAYRPGFVWWEVLYFIRRSVFVAVGRIIQEDIRTFTIAILCLIVYIAHVRVRPYTTNLDNFVEEVVLAALTTIALTRCASLYVDDPASLQPVIMVVVLATVVFVVIAALIRFRRPLRKVCTIVLPVCVVNATLTSTC